MKTLHERAQALLDSAKDWYGGKERALHTEAAEVAVSTALELEVLRERVRRLEDAAVKSALS